MKMPPRWEGFFLLLMTGLLAVSAHAQTVPVPDRYTAKSAVATFKQALIQFSDPDPAARADAAWVLADLMPFFQCGGENSIYDLPPKGLPHLYRAMGDPVVSVRRQVASSLYDILNSYNTIITIKNLGHPAEPFLLQSLPPLTLALLNERDPETQITLLKTLGMLAYRSVVPFVLPFANDKNVKVRLAAMETLGTLGTPDALPPLLNALKEKDVELRRQAVIAIGKIGNPDVTVEVTLLAMDPDPSIRRELLWTLGNLRSPDALPTVMTFLDDPNSVMRLRAVRALGLIGSPTSIPALLNALQDRDRPVRLKAVGALGGVEGEALVPVIEALVHADKDMRQTAAQALSIIPLRWARRRGIQEGHGIEQPLETFLLLPAEAVSKSLRTPKIRDTLTRALKDPDPDVRRAAVIVLGNLKEKETAPLFQSLRDDPDVRVREAANRMLAELGEPLGGPFKPRP